MWFIFPQLAGLGSSKTSNFYAIKNLDEASAYLKLEVLGERLIEISKVLLSLEDASARGVFGSPDYLKLKSYMTLFSLVEGADGVFQSVLDKYFGRAVDVSTVKLLSEKKAFS